MINSFQYKETKNDGWQPSSMCNWRESHDLRKQKQKAWSQNVKIREEWWDMVHCHYISCINSWYNKLLALLEAKWRRKQESNWVHQHLINEVNIHDVFLSNFAQKLIFHPFTWIYCPYSTIPQRKRDTFRSPPIYFYKKTL